MMLTVLAPARPTDADRARKVAVLLARADHCAAPAAADGRALYADLFSVGREPWPDAALARQLDAGDAGNHAWLRADPAHFRAEPGSVRLMACGDLGQDGDEVESLLSRLCPMFGEEGFELSAPHPARWYLRPFADNAAPDLPVLPAPDAALGGDLFELWPEDDLHRRWRRLFSEAQILLARHPVNLARTQAGRPAINGLWFWGAGRHPGRVGSDLAALVSDDVALVSLATAAGIVCHDRPEAIGSAPVPDASVLLDLRSSRNASSGLDWLLGQWRSGRIAALDWRTPGLRLLRKPWHRWRFWRR